ncbi:YiaA/YiaB family inner membrane protein [Pendulispora rubella]
MSFVVSVGMTGVGIAYLPVDAWVRGFLGMGVLFTVGSCFSLAKTIRDEHEDKRLISRIDEAKTTRILRDFEKEVT